MSKIDLDPITSGYNLSKINANFQKVEDELNNKVLYRQIQDGEPNAMSENLDMNSNEIINASKISSNTLVIGGVPVIPEDLVVDPYNGTREALRRSYAEAGYNLVDGSFERGGTVTSATDVLLYEASGHAYNFDGAIPVGGLDVPQDSTPATAGGIGPGLWLDQSGTALRLSLSASEGASLVGGKGKYVPVEADSVSSAKAFDGDRIVVDGMFYDASSSIKSALLPVLATATVGVSAFPADLGKIIGDPVLFSSVVVPEFVLGGASIQNCVFDPIARKYYIAVVDGSEPQQSKVAVYSANPDDTIGARDFITDWFVSGHFDFVAWERKADGVYMWFVSSDTATYEGTFKIRRRKLAVTAITEVFGTVGDVYSYIGNYGPEGVFLILSDASDGVQYLSFSDLESGAVSGAFLDFVGSTVASLLPANSGQQIANPTGNHWLGISGLAMNTNAADAPTSVAKRLSIVSTMPTDSSMERNMRVQVPGPTTGYIEPESIFLINDDVAISGINPYESTLYIYKLTGSPASTRKGVFQRQRLSSSLDPSTPVYNSDIPVGVPALYIGSYATEGPRVTDVEMTQVSGAGSSPARRSFRQRMFYGDGAVNAIEIKWSGKLDTVFHAGFQLVANNAERAGWSEEDGWMGGGIRAKPSLGYDVSFSSLGKKVGFYSHGSTKAAFLANEAAIGNLSLGVVGTQAIRFGGYDKNTDIATVYWTMNSSSFQPQDDNLKDFGTAAKRGRTAYFGTGAINTSDEREKTFLDVTAAEAAVAKELKGIIRKFQFNDALATKGAEGARYHFGVGAQKVGEVFLAHGLDPHHYALFCYDEWGDIYTQEQTNHGQMVTKTRTVQKPVLESSVRTIMVDRVSDTGEKIKVEVQEECLIPKLNKTYIFNAEGAPKLNDAGDHAYCFERVMEDVVESYNEPAEPIYESVLETPAGNRYGIRYDELWAFIISAM